MNIPNLDFEISLAISFWNSPSKIDWFKSLPSEGTLSIIVWVVLIIAFFIQYSGQQMKLWQIIWIPWVCFVFVLVLLWSVYPWISLDPVNPKP